MASAAHGPPRSPTVSAPRAAMLDIPDLDFVLERAWARRDASSDAFLSDHGDKAARLWAVVLELADWFEVAPVEVEAALPRLLSLALVQGESYERSRASLVEALQGDLRLIDPLPRASIAQARRTAELRNRLLASGAWSVPALAEVRDVTEGTARTWLKRHRDAHRLVTVTVHREVYVPAVLLDEAAEPWPGVEAVLGPLVEAGMDGWAVWTWLDARSSWLDGQRPAELLASGELERAAAAAAAKASTAAGREVA